MTLWIRLLQKGLPTRTHITFSLGSPKKHDSRVGTCFYLMFLRPTKDGDFHAPVPAGRLRAVKPPSLPAIHVQVPLGLSTYTQAPPKGPGGGGYLSRPARRCDISFVTLCCVAPEGARGGGGVCVCVCVCGCGSKELIFPDYIFKTFENDSQ
jgi:hypothetical protein